MSTVMVMMPLLIFAPIALANVADEAALLELTELSLEDLLQVEVTTVSKSPQKLSEEATAVYVLTRDDIRASGVSTIPDALRLVPGLQVAQVTAQNWAVTARGFNNSFNNKFLVLIDGRSVFSPLFNGVDWSTTDVPLEQIERIEVIRGPGGTLWETKAMNGVLNIITQSAQDTQGFLARVAVGTEHRVGALVQQGVHLNEDASLRLWGKYDDIDSLALHDGSSTHDGLELARGGFRLDWQVADNHTATFSGDCFTGESEDKIKFVDLSNPPWFMSDDTSGEDKEGGHFLARWEWQRDTEERMSLQAYYSGVRQDAALLDASTDTFDLEFNHRLSLGDRHSIGWGAGYRYIRDDTDTGAGVSFHPPDDTSEDYSFYLQDVFQLIPDKLTLTFSMKAEHNSYTGWEFQPSGRFLWKPAKDHTIWGALSRSVRTPARTDLDVSVEAVAFPGPGGEPVVVLASGNPDLDPEEVLSWELGYRTWPNSRTSVDVALFYSQYDDLIASVPGDPYPQFTPDPFRIIMPMNFQNALKGHSSGVELAVRIKPVDWLRVNFNYTWLDVDLDDKVKGASTAGEGSSPEHQASILSSFDIGEKWQAGIVLRYVGDVQQYDIPAYLEGDLQLSWQPSENLELTLAGRNLFDSQHLEYQRPTFDLTSLEVERSALAKVTWTF